MKIVHNKPEPEKYVPKAGDILKLDTDYYLLIPKVDRPGIPEAALFDGVSLKRNAVVWIENHHLEYGKIIPSESITLTIEE